MVEEMNKKWIALAVGSVFVTGAVHAAGFSYSGTADRWDRTFSGTTGTETADTITVGGLTSNGAVSGTTIKELPV